MRRLLIISCSQRKSTQPELLPAVQRYDGPTLKLLRRFLREQPEKAKLLDVHIISAVWGLIPCDHLIHDYDLLLTSQRAVELNAQVLATFASIVTTVHTEVCVNVSKSYSEVLRGWSEVVPSSASVTVIEATQGLRLTYLKQWLYGEVSVRRKNRRIEPSGVARLKGVELRLTIEEITRRARTQLSKGEGSANSFREWYVELDDCLVSIKWLVSLLSGLPVNRFTSGEARRVLCQLGLNPQRMVGSAT